MPVLLLYLLYCLPACRSNYLHAILCFIYFLPRLISCIYACLAVLSDVLAGMPLCNMHAALSPAIMPISLSYFTCLPIYLLYPVQLPVFYKPASLTYLSFPPVCFSSCRLSCLIACVAVCLSVCMPFCLPTCLSTSLHCPQISSHLQFKSRSVPQFRVLVLLPSV